MFKYGIFFTFVFLSQNLPPPLFSQFQFKAASFQSTWDTVCEGLFQSPFSRIRAELPHSCRVPLTKESLVSELVPLSSPSSLCPHSCRSCRSCRCVCVCVCVYVNVCSHERPWFGGSNCDPLFCWSLLFFHLTPAVCWLSLCLWHVNAGSLISSSGESALASS